MVKKQEVLKGGRLEQIHAYVEALQGGDLDRILELFAPRAKIVSPLEGTKNAKEFYANLLERTKESKVKVLETLLGTDGDSAAALLEYKWTLKNGAKTSFEVIDLFRFDAEERIRELRIFYDPQEIRAGYEAVRGRGK